MSYFTARFVCRLDNKNRLVLPQGLRDFISASPGDFIAIRVVSGAKSRVVVEFGKSACAAGKRVSKNNWEEMDYGD
ncbi:MAG: hypothetical protein V1834_01160 [Candidatus Micrarchaeota archaeon]